MEERIRGAVEKALADLGVAGVAFVVERPTQSSFGDYSTNAAMVAHRSWKVKEKNDLAQVGFVLEKANQISGTVSTNGVEWNNPFELAEVLAKKIGDSLSGLVSEVKAVRPGFINITLAADTVRAEIATAAAQGSEWGESSELGSKRVLVDYANPNQFKELHIGHLMSAILGESFVRLKRAEGAEVAGCSFGGDVGPHVAKALWALVQSGVTTIESAQQIGEAYARGATAYGEDTAVKGEIDALNVRIYDVVARAGKSEPLTSEDSALYSLWRAGREISMQEFRRIFGFFGTKLDYDFYDSDTVEPGLRTVRDGLAQGVFKESEGAVVYDGEAKGLHTLVFITSRGTPTYEAKDVGLAFLKEETYPADESIIVTSNEQIGHFKVVLAALEDLAPTLGAKTKHLSHGFMRLTSGKMSSREGTVITALDLLKEVTEKASEKNPDPLIAEQVAIGAIKYMVLRQAPGSDIIFDPQKSLSLEGDSGPYLQYALVRAKSVLAQAGADASTADEAPPEPYEIERLIVHYPEVVARAARELAPNMVVTYLTELAGEWNSFYAAERIIGGSH